MRGTLVTVNLLLGMRAIALKYQPSPEQVFGLLGALLGGPNPNTSAMTAIYYAGGFVASLNPFIAGVLTEVIITSNESIFFFSTTSAVPGRTVYVVGPWLIYTVMALLGTALFFALAIYLARPTRGGRRRQAA